MIDLGPASSLAGQGERVGFGRVCISPVLWQERHFRCSGLILRALLRPSGLAPLAKLAFHVAV